MLRALGWHPTPTPEFDGGSRRTLPRVSCPALVGVRFGTIHPIANLTKCLHFKPTFKNSP